MQFIKCFPERARPLFPYQDEVLQYMHSGADNGQDNHGIFFQMRLGKTLLAIRYCKSRGHNKVLVVSPLSIIEPTWRKELKKEQLPCFSFTAEYLKYLQSPRAAGELYKYETIDDLWHLPVLWAVVNPEMLTGRREEVTLPNGRKKKLPATGGKTNLHCPPNGDSWDAVIVDESTILANPDNVVSEFCCNYFRDAKCRIVLTGNPTPNDLAQYFQQIKFLRGSFLDDHNYEDFKFKHFVGTSNGKLLPKKASLPALQNELKNFCYKVRRQDVNVGSKKIYQQINVDFKPEFRELYDIMETCWALGETSTQWVIVAQNFLHQMCGGYPHFDKGLESHHKYNAVYDLLKGDLAEEKVIIWCRYRHEQARLYHRMQREWPDSAMINGKVPISERTHLINLFQNTSHLNKLICTYGTLDFGIDLSAADTTIYYSNSWSRNARDQSEDRMIHPEKEHQLLYIDLVTPNSIDCDILENHMDKVSRTDTYNEKIYASFLRRLCERDPSLAANALAHIPDRYKDKIERMKHEANAL